MVTVDKLFFRLDRLISKLKENKNFIGFLGLGSIGKEVNRIDQFSDLDFFVIIEDNSKDEFLKTPTWLYVDIDPSYIFQNSDVGHKVLYDDGVFLEYAIFEESEMKDVIFYDGTFIYLRDDKKYLLEYTNREKPTKHIDAYYKINEALTNIFVGLLRYHRGEKLSALFFIERYAFNNLLALFDHIDEKDNDINGDYYCDSRRFEQKFLNHQKLTKALNGYDSILLSVKVLLDLIVENFSDLNQTLINHITRLLEQEIQ